MVSRILTLTTVLGHLTAALLAEMHDVWEGSRASNTARERERVQVLEVHSSRRRGSSGAVETRGQIRAVESRKKMDGQRLGGYLLEDNTTMTTCFVVRFGDDSHRRDARHSHPCEDRRDANTAH